MVAPAPAPAGRLACTAAAMPRRIRDPYLYLDHFVGVERSPGGMLAPIRAPRDAAAICPPLCLRAPPLPLPSRGLEVRASAPLELPFTTVPFSPASRSGRYRVRAVMAGRCLAGSPDATPARSSPRSRLRARRALTWFLGAALERLPPFPGCDHQSPGRSRRPQRAGKIIHWRVSYSPGLRRRRRRRGGGRVSGGGAAPGRRAAPHRTSSSRGARLYSPRAGPRQPSSPDLEKKARPGRLDVVQGREDRLCR